MWNPDRLNNDPSWEDERGILNKNIIDYKIFVIFFKNKKKV